MAAHTENGRAEAIPRPIRRMIEFARANWEKTGEPFSDEAYSEATGLARSSVLTYRFLAMRKGWWPAGIVVPAKRRGRPEAKPVTQTSSLVPTAIELVPSDDVILPVDSWVSDEQRIAVLKIARQLLKVTPHQRQATLTLAVRLMSFLESE